MRAIVGREHQSPEHLQLAELAPPRPKSGEVLLKVRTTGLGYADALMVAGLYQSKPPLPFIPGTEICGEVLETGAEAVGFKPGERVVALGGRGLAEFTCVPAAHCVPLDERISDEAAAAFPVNYCTALHGLAGCGRLREGENLLILGAAGGVGMAAMDVARLLGARVIAAASTEEKRNLCLAHGAHQVLDYSQDDWRERLRALLGENPLGLVYDPVGGAVSEPALRSLAPGGRLLVVGFAAGEIPRLPLNLPLLKRCSIVGVNWGGWRATEPEAAMRDFRLLVQRIQEGRLQPRAGKVYPLSASAQALSDLLARRALGKPVVRVS